MACSINTKKFEPVIRGKSMIVELPGETEIMILGRILANEEGQIPPELALYLSGRQISPRVQSRMHHLLVQNQNDELSAVERSEMIALGRAATMLSILQSKARQALGIKLDVEPGD